MLRGRIMAISNLGELYQRLATTTASVVLKELGRGSYIYLTCCGRSVEISESDGKWWLEFWESSNDEDAGPVKELTVTSDEEAAQATLEWCGQ